THSPPGQPLRSHQGSVAGVAFSPDGTLATVGRDGTVWLWDVRTHPPRGQPLLDRRVSAFGVAFGSGGRTLASAGVDGTVRLWDGIFWRNFDELKAQVCSLVVGNLTKAEWQELAPRLAYRTTCPD